MRKGQDRISTLTRIAAPFLLASLVSAVGSNTSPSPASSQSISYRWVDVDGDGSAEWRNVTEDDDLDCIFDGQSLSDIISDRHGSGSNQVTGASMYFPLEFEYVWDSSNHLNNVWHMCVYGFDGDDKMGILSMAFSPQKKMYLFESVANNNFDLIWTSPSPHPPGAFVTVTGGDSDSDGYGEIIGGETSTLNQILLYEAVDDDSFEVRDINVSEPDPFGELSMDRVLVADTDDDNIMEIIFDTGGISGSKVFIYEQDGPIGENNYTKVYEYETVSYLVDITVGDSDNDGNQEIILGVGGFTGFPMYLRRLEYNPVLETYEHKMMEPGVVGLPLSPTVDDIDGDGLNELVMGSAVNEGGTVYILEATDDDQYISIFQSMEYFDGTVLTTAVGPVMGSPYPGIVAGSFGGELRLYGYDGEMYQSLMEYPITSDGSIRGSYLGLADGDERPDIVFSSLGADMVYVYEQIQLPFVRVDLAPLVTTVPRGEELEIHATLTNTTSDTQTFWGLTWVHLPGSIPYSGNPLLGPERLTLGPYGSISANLIHTIPNIAPLGVYDYFAAVGLPPDTVIDQDELEFEVVEGP
jgi:hypothetical protein